MTRAPRLLACLAALATLGLPSAAVAGDSTAVAVNTRDGSDVFRLAFHVNRVMSDTVDEGNAAVAFASCTDCQTVAIAIQLVLVMSDPSVVTPENLALAYNSQCSLCDTLASAYQLVLTTGGPVRFTPEGSRRLAEIHRRLLELRHADLTGFEIQAQVKALTTELEHVVATQLVPAGRASPPQSTGEAPSGGTGTTTTTSTTADGGTSSSTTTVTATTGGAGDGSGTTASTTTTSASVTTTSTGL